MTLRAAIFIAAAGSLLAAPPASIRHPPSRQGAPIEYRGFTFSAGSCEAGQPGCARSVPKAWTPSEIDVVRSAVDEILARTEGVDVVGRTQQRGVTVLRRYGVFIGRSGPVPAAAALRRDRILSAIEVYDSFFTSPGGRDSFSAKPGFFVVSAILLHECMHAIDDVSRELEFLKVAGFVKTGERWHFAVNNAEDAAALSRFNQEFSRFERAGDFMGEWRLGREAAMNMRPIRVPTIQATVRPAEAFAETGAILVLDVNARKYLRRDLVAYFDRHVFRPSAAGR